MKAFLTGMGVMGIAIIVLLFTGPGVFDLFSGLFDNKDIGTIVGLIVTAVYGIFVAQIGLVLAVILAGVVSGLFD